MKRTHLTCSLLFFSVLFTFAQTPVQNPTAYLGYSLGSQFTPHHRVVNYVEQLARQFPRQVKLIPYGTSYENRPLVVAVVASEENFPKLEEIRTNNLKSIGVMDGQPTAKPVAIGWMNYNIHGNEAVSTEAVMQVMYDLLDPQNTSSRGILANTVVVLDPCANPDGFDRYVNWFNQKVGRTNNPNPNAWEHREPWPGGRMNHYLYDLNRDWAWQVQRESQLRTALYQQWMPHLHADFHEMGPNAPYYFSPAAKPFHEAITPWQREFQQTIGEYNRKYFDKAGWLYFTKENFDLFYPSYGDTYPTYNGAIGMTYEQGGSGVAGLALAKDDGDTLTLQQRISHHVAASVASMEALSAKADRTVSEFIKFFEQAKNAPVGVYKSYVIKTKGDEGKVKAFTKYLDRQGFQYGYAGREMLATGYGFQSDKTESFRVESGDVVLNLYQPRSTMLKILMEPKSALEDSVTYDITSWSLPYAYGLKAFALKERINPVAKPAAPAAPQTVKIAKPYAYVVRWQSHEDAHFLAHLLQNKVRVRAAEKPFEIDGQSFGSGSLIITRGENTKLGGKFDQLVQEEARDHGVTALPVATGYVTKGADFGSNSVQQLKAPRIASLAGEGTVPMAAGEVWFYFDHEIEYPISVISTDQLANARLNDFDVLIMPNGNYSRVLTEKTLATLKSWVQAGGKLIAMEGSLSSIAGKEGFALKQKEEEKKDKKDEKKSGDTLKVYADRERSAVSEETPGSIYRVSLDNTHPLGYGFPNFYHSLVLQTTDYGYLKEGWNVGVLKKNDLVAGFAGKAARKKLENTLVFGVQELGRGQVVYLVNNPLFRGFWYSGKLLFANAVFMTGN
ncbi:MAG: M14 family metallopeptidase [Cytophagaceae bacterium]|nr:M14 family metallopeptidase [Cytophagaceae bacterium]